MAGYTQVTVAFVLRLAEEFVNLASTNQDTLSPTSRVGSITPRSWSRLNAHSRVTRRWAYARSYDPPDAPISAARDLSQEDRRTEIRVHHL